VQVLQVRFELHGHVQLHLLRIVFTRTMPSYMTSYVHMHTHVSTRPCSAYYLLFSIVRNGVNIMKISKEDPEICQKSQKYDANEKRPKSNMHAKFGACMTI